MEVLVQPTAPGGIARIARTILAATAVLSLITCVGCHGKSAAPGAASSSASAEAPAEATATPAPPLSAAQRQLATAFISAVNAKDAAALRKLVLPEALACYNTDTEGYLDRWVQARLRRPIPSGYKVSFSPYEGGIRSSRVFTIPVQPTERMAIEFSGARQGQNETLANLVVQEKGSYYLFAPCITAEGAERFKAMQAKREASAQEAREAYAKLKDPLRSQLVSLLKEGKKREAFSLCKRSLKISYRTAGYVLQLLEGREPGNGLAEMAHPSAAPTTNR
jgi:hypothetical protein